jgi:uncharacterized membrane protein (UPF0182 family)
MAWRGIAVAMIIIAVCLIALRLAADFLVDWLWFSAVGYPDVFWTILGAKVALFLAVFAASGILLWLNGSLASWLAERQGLLPRVVSPWGSTGDQTLAALLARLSPRFPWRALVAGGALVLAVFAASALLLWLNGSLAYRLAKRQGHLPPAVSPWGSTGDQTLAAQLARLSQHLPWRSLVAGGAFVLAVLIALGEAGNWDMALRFIRQAPYGQNDPLYGKDIGFYLFSLPAYVALKTGSC